MGVIPRENPGWKELRDAEVGGEEAKQACPEQHRVGRGLRGQGLLGEWKRHGNWRKGF